MNEKATPKTEEKAKAVEAEVKPEPKPEPIVVKAESAAPAPAPAKVEAPAVEASSELFSAKTPAYSAWVSKNSEESYYANLELVSGSAYSWPATSASEAEELLKYHITNQKL
jgi:hypothetical protein